MGEYATASPCTSRQGDAVGPRRSLCTRAGAAGPNSRAPAGHRRSGHDSDVAHGNGDLATGAWTCLAQCRRHQLEGTFGNASVRTVLVVGEIDVDTVHCVLPNSGAAPRANRPWKACVLSSADLFSHRVIYWNFRRSNPVHTNTVATTRLVIQLAWV